MRWLTNMCSTSLKLKSLLTNSNLKWNVAILITKHQQKINILLLLSHSRIILYFLQLSSFFFQFFEYQKSLFTFKHEHAMQKMIKMPHNQPFLSLFISFHSRHSYSNCAEVFFISFFKQLKRHRLAVNLFKFKWNLNDLLIACLFFANVLASCQLHF